MAVWGKEMLIEKSHSTTWCSKFCSLDRVEFIEVTKLHTVKGGVGDMVSSYTSYLDHIPFQNSRSAPVK